MSFISYLREAEKKEKAKKEKKVATSGTPDVAANVGVDGVVPGAATGNVLAPQVPPIDNIALTSGMTQAQQGNIEAYNVMRAFGMMMENNIASVVLLKSHPTPEIAQGAALLEKDIRTVIEYIMNMKIPI